MSRPMHSVRAAAAITPGGRTARGSPNAPACRRRRRRRGIEGALICALAPSRSILRDEIVPAAVRADADAIEIIGAGLEHVPVVGAGDDAQQVDLLLRLEHLERAARQIGPEIHLLRRAGVDM